MAYSCNKNACPGTIIRSLGQNPTDHEIHKYWKEMGTKEGIDSSTFIAIMMQILGNKESSFNETSEEVLDAFRVFDKNGEGFISGFKSKLMVHKSQLYEP